MSRPVEFVEACDVPDPIKDLGKPFLFCFGLRFRTKLGMFSAYYMREVSL